MTGGRDALFDELVAATGLGRSCGPAAFGEALRGRLRDDGHAEFLEWRMGYPLGPVPDAAGAFDDFAGDRAELAVLMLEGRLGYHAGVLPAVAEAVDAGPHAAVLVLGCNCGLPALYLARRFPKSRIVGIDRCAGLVGVARALRDRAGVPNAEFLCGEYAEQRFGRPFDVAVSLRALPAYFLSFVESRQPDSYRRGRTLDVLASDPVLPHRRVRECLEAVRRLLSEGGRAVMQERLADLSRVLFFSRLAAAAGLRTDHLQQVEWETDAGADAVRHAGPLIVAEARTPPAAFGEDQVIDLLYPPAELLPGAPAPGSGRVAVLTGSLAQQAYLALPAGRRLCVKAVLRDGRRRHVHLGLVEDVAAFTYACDTRDRRELRLADVRQASYFFAAAAQEIARSVCSGEAVALEPVVDGLGEAIDALLRGPAAGADSSGAGQRGNA